VLNNGIIVVASENPAADIISARMFLRGGSLYESLEQAGVAHLLSTLMTKGTESLSSHDIAERVESVGASLGTDASADYCLVSLKTVSADFANMLALAGDLMRSPSIPETELDLERRLTLQSIRSMQEQPFTVAQQQLRRQLYQDHPYALPVVGAESTVASLTRDHLLDYHRSYYRPDNLVISIVGRITPEKAIALAEQVFGDWDVPRQASGDPLPLPHPKFPPVQLRPSTAVIAQETQQSIIMLGYPAAAIHKREDYLALKLLSTYLGNGLSSRLFVELREKQGLAYEVSGFYPTRLEPSHFVVYMGTSPTNTTIALEGLRREVDRLRDVELSAEELQTAKNKLLGQYALGKQTNSQIAHIHGWYELIGLGIVFDQEFQAGIAAVTPADAMQVAHRYFTEPCISLVGPEAVVSQFSLV
jgi:predicted Zn-dependent peptidase